MADSNASEVVKKITVLVSFSGDGGVEVVTANLVEGWINLGVEVELLLIKNKSRHLSRLPTSVKQTKLKASSGWLALPEIVKHLKEQPPEVFFVIKDRAVQIAALAKVLSGFKGLMIGQIHNNMEVGLRNRNALGRSTRHMMMRWAYKKFDKMTAVSQDAADSIQRITGISKHHFVAMANPILTDRLFLLAESEATHNWLTHKDKPVLVAVGRLSPQKNFSRLINAFAKVKEQLDCRLIIFGEGKQKQSLQQLTETLRVTDAVDLAGFTDNPYAELKEADLFVLSSDWEGSPTVLSEALALGVNVVSTECGDVSITLQNGVIGSVVQPNNLDDFSQAILSSLRQPKDEEVLKQAVVKFQQNVSAKSYLDLIAETKNSV
ncbi:MAG: glycosyltransferase [Alteromonadaceae bacterium]|nr:glycosyltransferase [Alteromonadaceae bacterium]